MQTVQNQIIFTKELFVEEPLQEALCTINFYA